MAKYLIDGATLTAIADAIRNGSQWDGAWQDVNITPEQMPSAIADIRYDGYCDGEESGYANGYNAGLRTLQGCFALKSWVSDFGMHGTYTLPNGVFTEYNHLTTSGNDEWVYEELTRIEVTNDCIFFYTDEGEYKVLYCEDGWYGEDDQYWNDQRYMYIDIPQPVQVTQDVYNILREIIDVENYNAFTLGVDVGYSAGQTEGLEALGVLCEWQVMVDSYSIPVVDIANCHPSYYLHCTVMESHQNSIQYQVNLVIPPNSSRSYSSQRYDDSSVSYGDLWFHVENVRWKASAT